MERDDHALSEDEKLIIDRKKNYWTVRKGSLKGAIKMK